MTERSIPRGGGAAYPVSLLDSGLGMAGFFHPARGSGARSAVVVLCKPLGWEASAAQRGYRHLAEKLAGAGFPVLRFDYPGTGDSLGGDGDPARVRSWLDGLRAAIEEAQRLSGKREVSLVGIHMGATLAMAAALERGGVASLALWSPYAKGKSYLREVKAFRALSEADRRFPRAEDQGGLEAAGFLFTAAMAEELAKLDLLAAPRAPAPRVLLLGRDQHAPDAPLAARLESLGVEVARQAGPGYQELMLEPHRSVIPEETFASIAAYLSGIHPAAGEPGEAAPPPASRPFEWQPASGPKLREEAIAFGPRGRLFGVLCEPLEPPAKELPAILFLSTASHHRIGPNRMYVPLARELASRGFTSLRFDLTGVGDSPAVPGIPEGQAYSKVFVADVQLAMDHLGGMGFQRFVTIGLCSGAYLGFHASLADARIAGEVLINPQTFNWKVGDSLEVKQRLSARSSSFYKRHAFDPEIWRRLLKGEVDVLGIGRVFLERTKTRYGIALGRLLRSLGSKPSDDSVDVGEGFVSVLTRGADVLLIYGDNDEGLDYLSMQVGRRLGKIEKLPGFRLQIIEGSDHTFTHLWAQDKLRQVIVEHLQAQFGA